MASSVVRIPDETVNLLHELADREELSPAKMLAKIVRDYERRRFWLEAREALERIHADPVAKAEYIRELEAWDAISNDELEREPPYQDLDELDRMKRARE